MTSQPLPFGVYIHWPYCEAKCPYCDFNSYARRTITEAQFLDVAKRELQTYAGVTKGRRVSSIFLGGGTPSLMTPATVAGLLDEIAKLWPVAADCEITLEANPSSVEAGRFAGYRMAGVNRVSLGVQALSDEILRFLGRLHSEAEARAAIDIAKRHFERVTFDLIYARPGQTLAEWQAELKEALSLSQGHLSLYQLTIEPETAFFELERRGKLKLPEGGLAADLYNMTGEMCEAAGLSDYEVSNYAAVAQESRHNLVYWRYHDYVGVGPGAHGRLSVADGRKFATAAVRGPQAWYERVMQTGEGGEERVFLSQEEQAQELLLMGLRLSEGVLLRRLEAETGFTVSADEIQNLSEDGLLEFTPATSIICATRRGRLVLNALIERLAGHLRCLH